jgi:hypothetical protein
MEVEQLWLRYGLMGQLEATTRPGLLFGGILDTERRDIDFAY